MTPRSSLFAGALALFTGVGTGAFGAHGLKAHVGSDLLAVWETAVLYQLVHGLGLLAVVACSAHLNVRLQGWACTLLTAGILVFSGSLYILVLSGSHWLGAITPLGGLAFMGGWALLALAALKR
ncbi:MAG: DUF423 domain-containing protein [Alcaligenaceae bacterium]|jgi:uncharacterized membrane protein YgdD (TMEM256/DUF423 family)|nr:DUF423 domain-containing protein [Alcaligenaceae bacterium]